jgi:hypothetical protein
VTRRLYHSRLDLETATIGGRDIAHTTSAASSVFADAVNAVVRVDPKDKGAFRREGKRFTDQFQCCGGVGSKYNRIIWWGLEKRHHCSPGLLSAI